jgi:hypothetical protein
VEIEERVHARTSDGVRPWIFEERGVGAGWEQPFVDEGQGLRLARDEEFVLGAGGGRGQVGGHVHVGAFLGV